MLWGQFVKFGDEIRIDATLQDLAQRKTTPLKAMAANQAALLTAIAQLAESVQQVACAPDRRHAQRAEVDRVEAVDAVVRSAPAVQRRTAAPARRQTSKRHRALRRRPPKPRIQLRARVFRAWPRRTATSATTREAGQFSRRAIGLSEALPPQEKYLISANHYRIMNDTPKAIEAYENLAKASPNSAISAVRSRAACTSRAARSIRRVSASRKSSSSIPSSSTDCALSAASKSGAATRRVRWNI